METTATSDAKKRGTGMFLRNGVWQIDKLVRGVRLRRSARTQDYNEARQILDVLAKGVRADLASMAWEETVQDACMNSARWLPKILSSMRTRAKRSRRQCSIDLAALKMLLLATDGKCAVSGLPFVITDEPHHPFQPSVDRIDGNQGYVLGNVRFVCLAVNVAMNRWGQDNLLRISKGMVLKDMQRQLDGDPVSSIKLPRKSPPSSGLTVSA